MSVLTLSEVTKYYGAELILDSVSFRLDRGDHTGLIGVNGAGKSTLLRIIAGLEEPDAGNVGKARNLKVAYLPQEPEFEDTHTLYEALLDVFADTLAAQERLRALESEMASGRVQSGAVEEYGRLQSQIEHVGYDFRERIERVLTGLGFLEPEWYTPVSTLSGGQQTRANLARVLLQDADLLLLDEPTNHLDIPAVEWLEAYLRDLKQAFVVVAHDRYLLDRVTGRTLELSSHRVTEYDVPYSRYLELKAERDERRQLEYEAQQRQIAKTEEFVRRYGAGQRSKEARGRQKRLDRLDRLERVREEETVSLQLRRPRRSGDIVLETRDLVAGFPGKPLLRLPGHLMLRRGDKVALIGPNGSGKTTLLRTLLGELPPLEGIVRWGSNTSIGYYSQTLAALDERRTVLEEIQATRPVGEEEARGYLGRFLFSGDDAFKTVSVLSGGEKSRVALARLILDEPNVLVLDEPTNHLDITSRDALESVLAEFGGTLLFVSHDRYLIDTLVEQLWVAADGRLVRYAGTYSDLAAGRARALDAAPKRRRQPPDRGTPIAHLRRLDDEAESLAARLAAGAATIPVAQLAELTDRYSELVAELRETQGSWLHSIRGQLRGSSASPGQSAAAKRP
jgi:ATP-binding cassette subfamily F protein 3